MEIDGKYIVGVSIMKMDYNEFLSFIIFKIDAKSIFALLLLFYFHGVSSFYIIMYIVKYDILGLIYNNYKYVKIGEKINEIIEIVWSKKYW